jgi:hypothetical protein
VTAFATLNGARIISGSLTVPYYGTWTADVVLAQADAIATTPMGCTIVLGNLTLVGTAFRTASFSGARSARIVGGAAGWLETVTAQQYHSSGGVQASMVLGDAASAVGERVSLASNSSLGSDFVRAADRASNVLEQVSGGEWWVDSSGTTRVAPRENVVIGSAFVVEDWSGGKGRFTIATEDYASWLPGATFSSPTVSAVQTISSVTYRFENDGRFRLEVLAEGAQSTVTLDRIFSSFRSLIQKLLAPTRYYGTYEYTIVATDGTTVDGTPNDTTRGLPSLNKLELRADSIAAQTPQTRNLCHVIFVNGDPTKPKCTWTQPDPTSAQLLGGSNPVARLGDQVQVFLPPTLPIAGTLSGAPFTGVITVTNPLTGSITQGSQAVSSE